LPELRLTRLAKERLAELPQGIREAVFATLALIRLEPDGLGTPLVGRLTGVWATPSGSYRVLYPIERSGVVVRSIRHRAIAYRARRRRRPG